ncbi:MAG: trypsin-like serine protease [Bacteroidota bacterium]|nr:trypsin-like serine protease [Bacteroidota bacterium]
MKKILLIPGIIVLCSLMAKAQISEGGAPEGFRDMSWQTEVRKIILQKPEIKESAATEAYLKPERIGISIPAGIDFVKEANQYRENGKNIFRLAIGSEGAKALGVYYDAFLLPIGARLFLYNKDRSKLIGAFTSRNNRQENAFATEPLPGDLFFIELEVPVGKANEVQLHINEIAWYYKEISGFGDSGPCEVNVNCSEGNNWRNQINGIARIIVKANGGQFWCTGSLINNTRLDNRPYFFTADHCGKNASSMDYNQWIFYFNYESEDCANPSQPPGSKTMIGAVLRARSEYGTSLGSDFKLLELAEQVPSEYNPFFNGWSRSNAPSGSGVSIHHPQGDIKKISTYKEQLLSTPYASGNEDPDEKYWRVIWSETQSNHGVTEGGSSGAPIFNAEKKIVGTLTGGTASCDNLQGPDYYGKFWYSWESNGTDETHQLAPWLDPDHTGVESIPGVAYDQDVVVADFQALRDTVAVGKLMQIL